MIIKPVMDDTGMVVFDALPSNVATFSSDGWLGSTEAGASNRVNLTGYTSNINRTIENMIKNDLKTNSMLSNITNVITHLKYETEVLETTLHDNSSSDDITYQAIQNRFNSVYGIINLIIGAVNNLNSATSEIIRALTAKNIYGGQSYSDFQLALLMPAFHIDSYIHAIQEFPGGLQAANDNGNLPNYLLTCALRFQIDFLTDILIPDFQKMHPN